ncbi:MAG TPA: rhomboid family intramembrane serine protease [Pirellulales bacterium]
MPIAALIRLAERYPVIVAVELAAIVVTLSWWSGGSIDLLTMDGRTWQGEFWRPFSSALPHVNILHLVFNLWWVAILGARTEEAFGSLITLFWLLIFAGGSMVAEYDLADGGVGLSGAGYALFGFLWALSKRDWRFRDAITPQTTQLFIGWFFFCIAMTYTGLMPVANVAHGAGAGLGALGGLVMSPPQGYRRSIAAATLTVALAAIFATGAFARSYVNMTGSAGWELAKKAFDAAGRGDNQAATAYLERAVRLRRVHGGWFHNLGVAYLNLGRPRDAARAFRRAAQLDLEHAEDAETADLLEAGSSVNIEE